MDWSLRGQPKPVPTFGWYLLPIEEETRIEKNDQYFSMSLKWTPADRDFGCTYTNLYYQRKMPWWMPQC